MRSLIQAAGIITIMICSFQVYALESIGKAIVVTGKVTVENATGSRNLIRGGAIYVGDKISTDQKGTAHIRFTDKTLVDIEGGSIFVVEEYVYDIKNPKVNKQTSGLLKGGFKTITGLISKGDYSKYKVNTPVATMGVRSTEYMLYLKKIHNKWVLWLSVIKGTACAESFNKCFSSNSRFPNAKITEQGAFGRSQLGLSEVNQQGPSSGGEEAVNAENDEMEFGVSPDDISGLTDPADGTNIEQDDMKGLEQDFTHMMAPPAVGGNVPGRPEIGNSSSDVSSQLRGE